MTQQPNDSEKADLGSGSSDQAAELNAGDGAPAEIGGSHFRKDPLPFSSKLSDLGNAARLVRRHGQDLVFSTALGWMHWDGRRWNPDSDLEIERRAYETVQWFLRAALADPVDEVADALVKWARKSESQARIRAMVELARPFVAVEQSLFDADPWLLNTGTGTIDLRTGELLPHRREDYLTRLVEVGYDPEATAPTFEKFLDTVFAGDRDLIGYVQRAVGLAIQGGISGQVLFFLIGTGSNGKTTFIEALHDLLGGYARKLPVESLMKKPVGSVRNDLAQLPGVRLVTAVESDIDGKLAEGLVKSITGGDTISARFLYREFFDFRPQLTPMVSTNHLPMVRGTDHAVWRRIKAIPFDVTIPDEEQDQHLPEKLRAELPGVLAWAVRGCLEWQQRGLDEPEAVTRAIASYRTSQDLLALWLADECQEGAGLQSTSSDLYSSYQWWAGRNGGKDLSHEEFGRLLAERGFERDRQYISGKRFRVWVGLRAEERSARETMG